MLIAREKRPRKVREHGLAMETTLKDNCKVDPIKVADMEHYHDRPDMIFTCAKGYSLPGTALFLQQIYDAHMMVIPILNIYETGEGSKRSFWYAAEMVAFE